MQRQDEIRTLHSLNTVSYSENARFGLSRPVAPAIYINVKIGLLDLLYKKTLDLSTMWNLTYRRVVIRFVTSDDLSLCFFSKPSEPTELQNKELIENS